MSNTRRGVCAAPVCLVQDDDLVAAGRQCHLLLRKHLDLVAHHINAPAREEVKMKIAGVGGSTTFFCSNISILSCTYYARMQTR